MKRSWPRRRRSRSPRPTPDILETRFATTGPGFLVIADNFDKGWSATLDGRPARLLRADYAFKALVVPTSGPHVAKLRYAAPCIHVLYRVALLGALSILLAAFLPPGKSLKAPEAVSRELPDLPQLSVGRAVLVVLPCAALWLAGFVKFQWLKHPGGSTPFWYIAVMDPLVGFGVCAWLLLWYGKLRRRQTRHDVRATFDERE